MLSKNTVNLASGITTSLGYEKKRLIPLPGTQILQLVTTLQSFNDDGSDEELINQSLVAGSSTGTHDEVEAYVAAKIANIMGNVINTAKNVVNPHCRLIVEGITTARQSNIIKRAKLGATIQQIDLPRLLADDMFIELVTPYKETAAGSFNNVGEIFASIQHDFTVEELLLLMQTGSSNIDDKVAEYIAPNELCMYATNVDTATLSLSTCIGYFLLFTGILIHKLEKANYLADDSITHERIASMRAAMGGRIYRTIAFYEECINRGEIIARGNILVSSDNTASETLYVNGITYRNWIKNKGGSPEAALGYYSKEGAIYNYAQDKQLSDNPSVFYEEYERKVQYARSLDVISEINHVRSYTSEYLTDLISNMVDADRAALQQRLAKALQHEYHGATMLTEYVIKVVAGTLTEGNEVKNLLLEMEDILKSTPDATMDYAVYISCIRLIARWLRSSLRVDNNGS